MAAGTEEGWYEVTAQSLADSTLKASATGVVSSIRFGHYSGGTAQTVIPFDCVSGSGFFGSNNSFWNWTPDVSPTAQPNVIQLIFGRDARLTVPPTTQFTTTVTNDPGPFHFKVDPPFVSVDGVNEQYSLFFLFAPSGTSSTSGEVNLRPVLDDQSQPVAPLPQGVCSSGGRMCCLTR